LNGQVKDLRTSNKSRFLAALSLVMGLLLAACSKVEPVFETLPLEVVVHDEPTYEDAGFDARGIYPGRFGAEYGRMLQLDKNRWLAVYTIYNNNGYTNDENGGTMLQFSESRDNGLTWEIVSTITEPGRNLDNGQLIRLKNGDILVAFRSVRWQESYKLDVYRSTDEGRTWTYLSTIDENHGAPGELGWPDKGVYEPHMGFLSDGRLAVFYASEKHVVDEHPYSQIIAEKISDDGGATWGEEIFAAWDPDNPGARPGMPVWTQMKDKRYILVHELCGSDSCNVYYKISEDGFTWEPGVGTNIPDQVAGPYIASMPDGTLVVTSNAARISVSGDYGKTWRTAREQPWPFHLWASVYPVGKNIIAVMNSVRRDVGGHYIGIKYMELPTEFIGEASDG